MDLNRNQRAKIYLHAAGRVVADSFFLSERVDIDDLPPLIDAERDCELHHNRAVELEREMYSAPSCRAARAMTRSAQRSIEEEHAIAFDGGLAASQRFSDRGQRIISVSVPIQRVSAVVGVLTLESI